MCIFYESVDEEPVRLVPPKKNTEIYTIQKTCENAFVKSDTRIAFNLKFFDTFS